MSESEISTWPHTIYKETKKKNLKFKKGLKDLTVRPETIKSLEENIEHSFDINGSKNFCMSPQAKETEANIIKWGLNLKALHSKGNY